jgi:uncharacterized membrane protein
METRNPYRFTIIRPMSLFQLYSIAILAVIDISCLIGLITQVRSEAERRHKKTIIVFAYSFVAITIMIVGILLGGNPPDWICGVPITTLFIGIICFLCYLFYLGVLDYAERSEAYWRKRCNLAVEKSLNDPEIVKKEPNFKK